MLQRVLFSFLGHFHGARKCFAAYPSACLVEVIYIYIYIYIYIKMSEKFGKKFIGSKLSGKYTISVTCNILHRKLQSSSRELKLNVVRKWGKERSKERHHRL